jgi:ATP-dependent DNA helicase RecQ
VPVTDAELKRTMRRVFGVETFRPGQREVIAAVLARRDALAIMPTGAGKSLCYQLPGLHLRGTTVVISPLIALMKDQTDKLGLLGIDASQVNSGLRAAEASESLNRIRRRRAEFILTTPERIAGDAGFLDTLSRQTIDFVVVDEAHCVSQWGHDFRPSYLEIKRAIERLGHPPVLALTATATPDVVDDIVRSLGLREPVVVNTGIYRPNLQLEVLRTPNEADKRLRLAEILRGVEGTGIVYTQTVKDCVAVHEDLRALGLEVGRYHGRLAAGERRETQERFMRGEMKAIVATNAFGMGIDKPDIRFVVHHAFPGSVAAYYQEAGRAGRDGNPARCTLLYRIDDRRTQKYFIASRRRGAETRLRRKALEAGELERAVVEVERRRVRDEDQLERMMRYAESALCRWRMLLEAFEELTDPDFRCGTCDNCRRPPELDIAPPATTGLVQ